MKAKNLAITVNVREMLDVAKVAEQIHRASQRNYGCDVTIFVNGESYVPPADGSGGQPRKSDETPEERKAKRLAARLEAEKANSLL